jgi:glycosyltransferase involved in cell wall biosynthesis
VTGTRQSVDLFWLGGGPPPEWPLGASFAAPDDPAGLASELGRRLGTSRANACLTWHARLGRPDPDRIERALSRPGDLWHAGLRLGLAGQPELLDFVTPTWWLHRDPDPRIEATSWRASLEACLTRTDVLRRIGLPRGEFESLAGASLELGHRAVSRGVLARHVPWLLGDGADPAPTAAPPLEDAVRFVLWRYGSLWARWGVLRAIATGAAPARALRILSRMRREPRPSAPAPFRGPAGSIGELPRSAPSVTVLIPTVDRYPYLRPLLDQLRRQTVPPLEILVLDQTAPDRRASNLEAEFPDLPLRYFALDRAGQCSSRNLGIRQARGDAILFLDDDDEVPADLIERHLVTMARFSSDVSSGVAEEDGAGPLPESFRLVRASDVFPTNNSLALVSALQGSGLFDLAYERGARADGDLGMRLYLSGAFMVLDPEISVLHHHAPSGGLRTHKARVVTRASSRARLGQRHLPSVTEVYLAKRYFNARQVRESLWHRALGTLRGDGSMTWRLAKMAVGIVLLPDTVLRIRKTAAAADAMLAKFPQIESLAPRGAEG